MRLIFSIVISLLIFIVALTSQYLLLERLFILVAFLLLLSYLIARSGTWGLKGNLIQPVRYQQAGKSFQVKAVVKNPGRLPKPFLVLNIKSNLIDSNTQNTPVNLGRGSTFNLSLPVTFPSRGLYKIGPLTAQSGDPLGVFRFKKKLDEKVEVLICPPTLELPLFNLSTEQESGLNHNNWKISESGSLVRGVRDYVQGDSFSRIHWRSTAHKGKLVVKEYEVESVEKIWLFLDLSKNNHSGNGVESTEEYCITIAASILKKYCEAGQQTGLIAQGESYCYFYPRSGSLNLWPILEAMAVMKANGSVPLFRIINRAYEQLDPNAVAVIITPGADSHLVDAIIRLKKRGPKLTVILLDAYSFGGENDTERAAKSLRYFNIPTWVVKKGDNLAEALNSHKEH
jgi:uncharacterized protein (DUF58 family)